MFEQEVPRWAWGLLLLNLLILLIQIMQTFKMADMWVFAQETRDMLDAVYKVISVVKEI